MSKSLQRTPLEEFINGFPLELSQRTMHAKLPVLFAGGDESHYWSMRTAEILPTAIIPKRTETMPLARRIMPEIGAIKAETEHFGTLTLNEFLARPDSFSQGYLVIHKGEIVFDAYPRMRPTDHHVWMSTAKPTASLLVELLINEGKIDEHAPLSDYIAEFKGTAWDNVTVNNTLNMATGLDVEDTSESRADPDSHPTRLYSAEFNLLYKGKVEHLIDVLADAEKECEPGEKFAYASAHTQALVCLVESLTGERWHQTFDRLVWSKMGVNAPLQVHTAPDGSALAHGVISSQLIDLARFGMLYTPSWNKTATEQVVSDETLKRIQDDVQTHELLMAGFDGPVFASYHGEVDAPTFISNSRQWDVLWPDNDMWKGGMMSQGLYVSPDKDLVVVYFGTNNHDHSVHRWARRIATSGLFS
ncbi:serine hydrolase domain-containing protein [Vibrio superstes]|uniref:Beta-lactamase-related domain-containing protein n=1 Tax=Vibrio superstes NBRC 103154 TaxID=1219062 RepID=A0A511QN09_9VIBR|nr:serine hydrolase domain-containing protein [Vibrio superstes]GEM78537.1 hypothetical protein VSU01S_07820 [Vibrio superstes NBRC 103154]